MIRGFYEVNSTLDDKGVLHFVITINHPESASSHPDPNVYALTEGQSLSYGTVTDATTQFEMSDLVSMGQGFNRKRNSDRRGYKNPRILFSEGYQSYTPAIHIAATEQRMVSGRVTYRVVYGRVDASTKRVQILYSE